MTHIPPTLAIIALDMVLVAPPGLSLIVVDHTTALAVTLPLRSLAAGTSALTVPPLTLIGPWPWGFLWCVLSP